MTNSKVVARMTIEREVGVVTIVEVHEDATFADFYRFYTQEGRRRSTKKHIRTASRNEGLEPHWRAVNMKPGLSAVADVFTRMQHVTSAKIRIIKKRAYRRLCTVSPDVLGLVKAPVFADPRLLPRVMGIPIRIPDGHTTQERKWSILTSRRKVPA